MPVAVLCLKMPVAAAVIPLASQSRQRRLPSRANSAETPIARLIQAHSCPV